MLPPALIEGPPPPKPSRVLPSQSWPLRLLLAFVGVCGAGYIAYIVTFGQNTIFWDEWDWVVLFQPGGLTFQALWAQHNENIVFFPNLVAILLIRATHWNDFSFYAFSAALMLGSVAIVLKVFAAEVKKSPLWWFPIPLIVLSLVQYQNILWAFQIAWSMIIFLVIASLALLVMSPPRSRYLAIALVLAILASYSSLQGLIIWPCGLLALLSRGQPKKLALIWSLVGLGAIVGYFVDFSISASGTAPMSFLMTHKKEAVKGLLISAGSVVPNINSGIPGIDGPHVTEAIGAVLFASGAAVTLLWIVQGRPSGARAFCVGLIFLTVAFDLLLLPGRLVYGAEIGAASRYSTFNWPILLGVYGYAVSWLGDKRRWRPGTLVLRTGLTSLVLVQVVVATIVGVNQGQIARTVRLTSTDVVANWQTAPPSLVGPYLYPPCVQFAHVCNYVAGNVRFVADSKMNAFADPANIARLQSQGIVPGGEVGRLLTVPARMKSAVTQDPSGQKAWNVLSTVYDQDPSLQAAYPETDSGMQALVAWAAAAAGQVTPTEILNQAWTAPLTADLFLQQYAGTYKSWAATFSST